MFTQNAYPCPAVSARSTPLRYASISLLTFLLRIFRSDVRTRTMSSRQIYVQTTNKQQNVGKMNEY